MRNLIIGMSVAFFAVSVLIALKALGIPARSASYQNTHQGVKSDTPSPDVKEFMEEYTKEQAANRALVEDLQATIARLEGKLSTKNDDGQTPARSGAAEKKEKVLAVLDGGSFRVEQLIINEDLMKAVQGLVQDISEHPESRVVIEGHTDNKPIRPSTDKRYNDNMDLSFLRAKAVAQMLEQKGIPPERISVIGYGERRPVATNETAEGRAKNRRVEVKLIPGNME